MGSGQRRASRGSGSRGPGPLRASGLSTAAGMFAANLTLGLYVHFGPKSLAPNSTVGLEREALRVTDEVEDTGCRFHLERQNQRRKLYVLTGEALPAVDGRRGTEEGFVGRMVVERDRAGRVLGLPSGR